MIFQNATDQSWQFAVYQTMPDSPGLSSVAWQIRGLPPQQVGSPPPQAEVDWTMQYGICIADFDKNFNRFTGTQFAQANLGNAYEVSSNIGIPSTLHAIVT